MAAVVKRIRSCATPMCAYKMQMIPGRGIVLVVSLNHLFDAWGRLIASGQFRLGEMRMLAKTAVA